MFAGNVFAVWCLCSLVFLVCLVYVGVCWCLVVAVGAGAAVKVFKSVLVVDGGGWWWCFCGVGTVTRGHFPF